MADKDALLSFPCDFAIKAMGLSTPEFHAIVLEIIHAHCAATDIRATHTNTSKNGKYHSITITINATRREQLDHIYHALSEHSSVIMAL